MRAASAARTSGSSAHRPAAGASAAEPDVPAEAAVFKDPATARSRMYVNDAGKAIIDELVASAGLSGIECGPPEPRL